MRGDTEHRGREGPENSSLRCHHAYRAAQHPRPSFLCWQQAAAGLLCALCARRSERGGSRWEKQKSKAPQGSALQHPDCRNLSRMHRVLPAAAGPPSAMAQGGVGAAAPAAAPGGCLARGTAGSSVQFWKCT